MTNIHKLSGISSVVDFDKLALLVELQFDAVGQFKFVAPVREQRHIREPGVSKVGKQCLYTSGVGNIAREGPVIHRHMVIQ